MAKLVSRGPVRQVAIATHPVYNMLLPVPVVCFLGALLTDIAYLKSGGNFVWLDFSTWLLLAGLLVGGVAAVILLVDLIRTRDSRAEWRWAHPLFFYAALLVELLSMFVHQRDGWTAVAGLGLILSIIGAALVLLAGWFHRPGLEVVQ